MSQKLAESITQPGYGEERLYINGELRAASNNRTYENIAPASGEIIGIAADASVEDAQQALEAARRAFDETHWSTDHGFRLQCLKQLELGMKASIKDLQDAVVAEAGSTRHNAHGPQVTGPLDMVSWTLDYLENFQWKKDIGEYTLESLAMTSRRIICKEAAGVVVAITPWNFPLQIILAKIIPALAAGCTVILKSAPNTPWTATLLGRIVKEHTDIPAGVFNVLSAKDPAEIGQLLTTDPRVDMVSFTGSTAIGKQIMVNAAATVKRVFLELGGKSANLILDDADLSSALLSCLAICYHAGQGCVIATRLLVPQERLAESEELLKTYMGFISYGDPEAEGAIMGPLISEKQRQRVLSLINRGIEQGARLVVGGGVPENLSQGFYVEPTVLVDEGGQTCVSREEIFGPVLTIIPYKDEADGIRIANDSIYGLGASVVSADEQRALRVAKSIRAGIVNVNGGNFLAPDAPFGGYKQSGVGREMGPEGFEEYLETKTIAIGV